MTLRKVISSCDSERARERERERERERDQETARDSERGCGREIEGLIRIPLKIPMFLLVGLSVFFFFFCHALIISFNFSFDALNTIHLGQPQNDFLRRAFQMNF